ncbi:replication initiation protein [Clostridium botulinum]|nr:replication initiation protein [Clostridium botulinum]
MDKNLADNFELNFIMNSTYELSREEQKIILLLANSVLPNDKDYKSYIFKINDLVELLELETKEELLKIIKEFIKKVVQIKQDNKSITTAWINCAIYEKNTDYVELSFNPFLKPYMLQLKKNNILLMKSKYSPRIYEILKHFKNQGSIEIELNELRRVLNIESLYPLYADFKRKIILQAQKELKKNTDIYFDFEEIKIGRKVIRLKFIIHPIKLKENSFIKPDEKEIEIELIMTITKNEFKKDDIILFREICKGNKELIKESYEKMNEIRKYMGSYNQKVDFMINSLKKLTAKENH